MFPGSFFGFDDRMGPHVYGQQYPFGGYGAPSARTQRQRPRWMQEELDEVYMLPNGQLISASQLEQLHAQQARKQQAAQQQQAARAQGQARPSRCSPRQPAAVHPLHSPYDQFMAAGLAPRGYVHSATSAPVLPAPALRHVPVHDDNDEYMEDCVSCSSASRDSRTSEADMYMDAEPVVRVLAPRQYPPEQVQQFEAMPHTQASAQQRSVAPRRDAPTAGARRSVPVVVDSTSVPLRPAKQQHVRAHKQTLPALPPQPKRAPLPSPEPQPGPMTPQRPAAAPTVSRRMPAAPVKPAARKDPVMLRAAAARVIQRRWRGWRLSSQREVMHLLMVHNKALRDAYAKFYQYLADTQGHITHKQLLEVNELAMRVLLALDECTSPRPELKAIRKRLTNRALSLQDQVHAAYQASSKSLAAQQRGASTPSDGRAAAPVAPLVSAAPLYSPTPSRDDATGVAEPTTPAATAPAPPSNTAATTPATSSSTAAAAILDVPPAVAKLSASAAAVGVTLSPEALQRAASSPLPRDTATGPVAHRVSSAIRTLSGFGSAGSAAAPALTLPGLGKLQEQPEESDDHTPLPPTPTADPDTTAPGSTAPPQPSLPHACEEGRGGCDDHAQEAAVADLFTACCADVATHVAPTDASSDSPDQPGSTAPSPSPVPAPAPVRVLPEACEVGEVSGQRAGVTSPRPSSPFAAPALQHAPPQSGNLTLCPDDARDVSPDVVGVLDSVAPVALPALLKPARTGSSQRGVRVSPPTCTTLLRQLVRAARQHGVLPPVSSAGARGRGASSRARSTSLAKGTTSSPPAQ